MFDSEIPLMDMLFRLLAAAGLALLLGLERELRGKAGHIEYLRQYAEIFGLNLFGIDVEVVTNLGIACLPESETFTSNLVGLQLYALLRPLDPPCAGSSTRATFEDAVGIDAIA